MIKAMYACPGYGEPFERRLAAVAEAGFDEIALDFEKELEPTETAWENQLSLAEQYHLPVEQVHLTGDGMNGIWKDYAWGDELCRRTLAEIGRMSSLGLSLGVIHVTWGLARPEREPNETGLRRFAAIAEEAEKKGVYVALENSVFSDYVAYLLGHIDSTHIGLCYDSGHKNAFTPDFDYLSRFGTRLFTTHLHDNNGKRDEHRIPYDGSIDFDALAKQFAAIPVTRQKITLECAASTDEPLEAFARRAHDAAIRLENQIAACETEKNK